MIDILWEEYIFSIWNIISLSSVRSDFLCHSVNCLCSICVLEKNYCITAKSQIWMSGY